MRKTTLRALSLVAAVCACTLLAAALWPARLGGTFTTSLAHTGLRVVATTGILADMVRNVAGDRAQVSQIIPDNADPHSFEPSLRAIRDVAYADVAFSNYLLLEQHAIIKALDANLPSTADNVSIAEEASKRGATILPMVENRGLDALWLGMRVHGDGAEYGANRASEVDLWATAVDGPGDASAYITTTFGAPEISFSSHDGFDDAGGADTAILPAAAHQHMSWAFTQPGIYRIHMGGRLRPAPGAPSVDIPEKTVVFAVGVDPTTVATAEGRTVVDHGHGDITVNLDRRTVDLFLDSQAVPAGASGTPVEGSVQQAMDLDHVVLSVPARTLTEVPSGRGFEFLGGGAGGQVYILPQAVLGKHVHGEIDPHLWHDMHNAAAYVRVIRDHLTAADPEGSAVYRANAKKYLALLERTDAQVAEAINSIPQARRQLVTPTDAYAYLGKAYGVEIAGFASPNPAVEPSLAAQKKLLATIQGLSVPAVFVEPTVDLDRSSLVSVAAKAGVKVCRLYGDTFDAEVTTYVDMMRYNAQSLKTCLGQENEQ